MSSNVAAAKVVCGFVRPDIAGGKLATELTAHPITMERLRGEKVFQEIFSRGERVQHPLITLLLLPGAGDAVRVGFCVSKKFGNAVARNRLKRLLREAGRRQLAQTPIRGAWEIICLPRLRAREADFAALDRAWQEALLQAGIGKDRG